MRTETTTRTLYSFDELPDDTKEKALDKWREHDTDWHWSAEWIDSLNAFCDVTGIDLVDYSIGPYSHSHIRWHYQPSDDFTLTELKGLRLRTWLINNWLPNLEKRKWLKSGGFVDAIPAGRVHPMVKYESTKVRPNLYRYYKTYRSNLTVTAADCPLTGFCGDMALIDPVLNFIKNPKPDTDLEDIINACMDQFIHECNADMEAQDSDEYIIDTIQANEYEFDESGNLA